MFLTPASQVANSGTNQLRSTYADDPEMGELVTYFVDAMGERVAAMYAALDDRDMALLHRLAHQLKGAAKGYGFGPITDRAATLDAMLKEDPAGFDIDAVTVAAERLIALCMRVSV